AGAGGAGDRRRRRGADPDLRVRRAPPRGAPCRGHARARGRRSRDPLAVGQGRARPAHATHARRDRPARLRSRRRPRALPGAGGAGDRGLRPGAGRRARGRPACGLGRDARRRLVLRHEDDRGGRGRGGGGRRGPRRARRGRAAAGVPSRPPRARAWRVSRGGPAVGGIAVDPVLSGAHRRRGRARRAGAQDGAHLSRPVTETLPDSTPAALGATLARGVVLIALMLPPVRRAIASSGLGWAYLVALAFALSLVGVPLVRAFARAWGVLDTPAARKVHAVATPLLGGAAVYAAFAAAVLFNF